MLQVYHLYFMTTWYTVIYMHNPGESVHIWMTGWTWWAYTQIDNPRAKKNMLGTGIMIWVMVTATRCCMCWITRLKGFGFSVPMLNILQIVVFLKVPWPHFDPGLFPPCCDSDFTGTTCKNCREDCTDSFAFLNLYLLPQQPSHWTNHQTIQKPVFGSDRWLSLGLILKVDFWWKWFVSRARSGGVLWIQFWKTWELQ